MSTSTTTTTKTLVTIEQIKAAVAAGMQIPTDAVLDTYRGRPGCGCGCRGTYSKDTRAINSRTYAMNAMIKLDATADTHYVNIDGIWTGYGDNNEDVVCFSFVDENITVWIYVDVDKLTI